MSNVTAIIETIKTWVLSNKTVVLLIFKQVVDGTANPYDNKLYEFVEFLLSTKESDGGGWFASSIAEAKAVELPQDLRDEATAAGFDVDSLTDGLNETLPAIHLISSLVNGK